MTDVKAIAAWTGWCDPCGTERPLSLTEAGPRGFVAWVRGISWEDRELGLYCRVCGVHQVVPLHEEDDPVVVITVPELLAALTRVGLSTVTLSRPARVRAAQALEALEVIDAAVPAARVTPAAPLAPAAPAPAAGRPSSAPVVPAQRVVTARPAVTSLVLPDSETALDLVAAGLVAGLVA
jgi:hypothetical protein